MKKREIKSAVKKIHKDIRAINKKIRKKDNISKIEKSYQLKKEIKNYYQQNKHQITDDILVAMYDEIYQPSVIIELSIGVFSGMLSSFFIDLLVDTHLDFPTDTLLNVLIKFIASAVIFLIAMVVFTWGLLEAYKQIRSLYSYSDEVNDFYKSYLKELIEERESKLHKEAADEQRNKKKNRKHK